MTTSTLYLMPCDHCGGTINQTIQSDDRGDKITYTCDRCNCGWEWGFVLVHKGPHCPVHGDNPEASNDESTTD